MGLSLEERVKKVQDIIMAVGLPKASILISSGNGIHAYMVVKGKATRGNRSVKNNSRYYRCRYKGNR